MRGIQPCHCYIFSVPRLLSACRLPVLSCNINLDFLDRGKLRVLGGLLINSESNDGEENETKPKAPDTIWAPIHCVCVKLESHQEDFGGGRQMPVLYKIFGQWFQRPRTPTRGAPFWKTKTKKINKYKEAETGSTRLKLLLHIKWYKGKCYF